MKTVAKDLLKTIITSSKTLRIHYLQNSTPKSFSTAELKKWSCASLGLRIFSSIILNWHAPKNETCLITSLVAKFSISRNKRYAETWAMSLIPLLKAQWTVYRLSHEAWAERFDDDNRLLLACVRDVMKLAVSVLFERGIPCLVDNYIL